MQIKTVTAIVTSTNSTKAATARPKVGLQCRGELCGGLNAVRTAAMCLLTCSEGRPQPLLRWLLSLCSKLVDLNLPNGFIYIPLGLRPCSDRAAHFLRHPGQDSHARPLVVGPVRDCEALCRLSGVAVPAVVLAASLEACAIALHALLLAPRAGQLGGCRMDCCSQAQSGGP